MASRACRSRLLRCAWIALVVASCTPDPAAELLEVQHVGPDRLEPGRHLRVRGAGFPPGRSGRVRIEGRMHRPGAAPSAVSVELPARAISAERVDARFTAAELEAFGGRGTVRGHVVVVFEAAGGGSVTGRSGAVVLDVVPPSSERLADELAHRHRASALLASLGLALAEETPEEPGLVVERVEDGSIAARAGLAPGDRLVALDGLRLHSISDFVPAPGTEHATIEVAREGEAATSRVLLAIATEDRGLTSRELLAAQIAVACVLLVVLLLSPVASTLDWLVTRRRTEPRATWRARARSAARFGIASAFFAAIALGTEAGVLRVPLEAVALAVFVARIGSAYAGTPRSGRVRAVLHAAGAATLAAVALAAIAALGGTTELGALADAQGALPWEWSALLRAPLLFCVALLVRAGAFRARGEGSASRVAAAIDEHVALVLAAALAATLLGGWASGESLAMRALGVIAFVIKGSACHAAMRRLGAHRELGWPSLVSAALVVALTTGWILWSPPAELERALAQAAAAAVALIAASVLYRSVRGDAPEAPSPAHPFA